MIEKIKCKLKKYFPLFTKNVIVASQILAKVIDFLLIPVAIIYDRKGINVFETKTRSFGHHFLEPIAVAVLNNVKNASNQKRLILLANQKKAYVKYTNTLLKQKFKIIDKYSYLNLYYWLARSKFCGISRSSKNTDNLYKFFYEVHYKYRNQLDIFDHSELQNDSEIKKLFKKLNPENRFIVVWKPKCHRNDKYDFYSPLRYSSLDSCKPLFDKIYQEGGIVFGLIYGDTNFQHNSVVDLRKVQNKLLLEKFVFYLDLNCKFAICGQNGGTMPLHVFKKPLIVYDVSYPYTINFCGVKTIISLKKANYKNGKPVRIETLVKLKLDDIKNIIQNKEMIFLPNSHADLLDLYKELKIRMKNNPYEFAKENYKINLEWGDKIPRNVYNSIQHCQIADCCYEKQYKSLAPKEFL